MDLNAFASGIKHSPAAMFAIGLATAHARLITHYAVLGVFKIPLMRRYLVGNPEEAKAALAVFVKEVDDDIDAAVAQDKAAAASAKAAPAPQPPAGPQAQA